MVTSMGNAKCSRGVDGYNQTRVLDGGRDSNGMILRKLSRRAVFRTKPDTVDMPHHERAALASPDPRRIGPRSLDAS